MAGNETTIGRLLVRLLLDDKDFQSKMKTAERSTQTLGDRLAGASKKINSVVVGAFKAATAAVAAFGVATVYIGAQFEKSITAVGAIAVDGADRIADLERQARHLGATTGYTATQAADAMAELARAGLKTDQIISASKSALLLAGSVGASMGDSTKLIAATMAQFQLSASQATRISDVFSMAMRSTLFDMSSLTEAMKYAGVAGAGFGYSLEKTTAAVALFRNLGLEGSLAGTAFRMAMAHASRVTEQGEKILRKYNLTAKQINPELNDFSEIMERVGKAGMSTSDSMVIFGTRAGAAVAQVAREFGAGSTKFYELQAALENSAGSTEKMYETMMNTVHGQFTILKSAVEELMLSLFDNIKAPLTDVLRAAGEVVQAVGAEVKLTSGEVKALVADRLGALAKWLRANKGQIVDTFSDAVRAVARLGDALATILPYLDEIGTAVLAIFIAQKVAAFAAAINGAAIAVQALAVGMTAAKGAAMASSLAFGAVGVAVAGVMVALAKYERHVSEVERRANASMEDKLTMYKAEREQLLSTNEALWARKVALEESLAVGRKEGSLAPYVIASKEKEIEALTKEIRHNEELALVRKRNIAGAEAILAKEKALEDARKAEAAAAEAQAEAERQEIEAALKGLRDIGREKANLTDRTEEESEAVENLIKAMQDLSDAPPPDVEDLAAAFEKLRASMTTDEIKQYQDALDRLIAEIAQMKKEWRGLQGMGQDIDLGPTPGEASETATGIAAINAAWADWSPPRDTSWVSSLDGAVGGLMSHLLDAGKWLLQHWQDVGKAIGAVVGIAGRAVRAVVGLFGKFFDFQDAVADLLDAKAQAEEDGTDFDMQTEAQSLVQDLVSGAIEMIEALVVSVPVFIQALVDAIPSLIDALIEAVPQVVDAIIAAIPVLIDALITYLPVLISLAIEQIPRLIFAVLDALPVIIETLAAGIVQIVQSLPDLIGGILERLPEIITALLAAVEDIVRAIIRAIPQVIQAVIDALPEIVMALVEGILSLVVMLAEKLPMLIVKLVEMIPVLVEAIVALLPDIITSIIAAIPDIIFALIKALPDLIVAFAMLLPDLVVAIIAHLPEIIVALVEGIVTEIILNLPAIAVALVQGIIEGLWEAIKQLADLVVEAFSGVFDWLTGGEDEKGIIGRGIDTVKGWFSGGSAYGGMDYSAATQRVTIHPGEVITPADGGHRSPTRAGRGTGSAPGDGGIIPIPQPAGGGKTQIGLAVMLNDRVVDEVLIEGMDNGRAPNVARRIRKASGKVKGYSRGKHLSWG